MLALGLADEAVGLELLERAGAVFEEGHPEEVLEVAQAAAAALEVGLLHGRRSCRTWRAGPPDPGCAFPGRFRPGPARTWSRKTASARRNSARHRRSGVPLSNEVFVCMSVLATCTMSAMVRTDWPTLMLRLLSG